MLLKWRIDQFLELARKENFLSLFTGIRVETHFLLKSLTVYLFKSSFKFCTDDCILRITEKSDVSSANNIEFETKFSGKSFIYIKKSSGPRIEP